ncbi:Mss4-like protein [Xylaria bambusicola]|uniref:Mss4-like protein n=1 Tax=Xylaria bambusicola TaxID=326684 RepID=UPI0020074779|nr:Mss4-like protein [Xylaria bambusicola]KAI0522068.1 Mss4-like protein [Xylaria bambusicola]
MKSPQGNPNDHPITEFEKELRGSCLCGSICVTIRDADLFTHPRGHLCHCSNCRKVAGSFVAANLVIETEKVDIQDSSGTLKTYNDYDTLSGNPVYRSFCSVDGNPIKSESPLYQGKVILKMGIFPRIPEPGAEGFALHRHAWEPEFEGTVKYKLARGGEKLE